MHPTRLRTFQRPAGRTVDSAEPEQTEVKKAPVRSAKPFLLLLVTSLILAAVLAAGVFARHWWELPSRQSHVVQEHSRAGEHATVSAAAASTDYASHGARWSGDERHVHDEAGHHDHEPHAHDERDHTGGEPTAYLQLSEQARKNVGLKLMTVQPRMFHRTINIPATVVERPGRTQLRVSAPMTGIVTRIYPIPGEAVKPGDPLFDLRLTHEDLVDVQSAFLQTIEQLDVINKEVARLDEITSSGAIAGKRLLERQYEQQKTEALLRAQRQALILHGLTEEQVEDIATNRQLLQEVTVVAPGLTDCARCGGHEEYLQVADLAVNPGQQVDAGGRLCTLTDHCELYVEGKAFEEDAQDLNRAVTLGTPVTAVVEEGGHGTQTVADLKVLYVENTVELASRALRFYVLLPNELLRNEKTEAGHRFISWRYKPGQRVQLHLPVETWEDRIVLPVEAVVQDGADCFIFRQNGESFQRKPVHVEYRDQRWAVIERDGALRPGDVVVRSGAYQMHLALKSKSGEAVDPHAGHHH